MPFVIYLDIESILEKYEDPKMTKNMKRYQKHISCSIAFYLLSTFNKSFSKFEMHTGKDCVNWFVKRLQDIAIQVNPIFSNVTLMKQLTVEQKCQFHMSTTSYLLKTISKR